MGFSNLLHQRKAKPQPVKMFEVHKNKQPPLHTCMPTQKCSCWWHIIYVDKAIGRQPVTPRVWSSPVSERGTHSRQTLRSPEVFMFWYLELQAAFWVQGIWEGASAPFHSLNHLCIYHCTVQACHQVSLQPGLKPGPWKGKSLFLTTH